MRFHRKIFLTIALTILGISLVYVTLTHFVVKRSIEAVIQDTRQSEVELLAKELSDYYAHNQHTWEGIHLPDLLRDIDQDQPSLLVTDNDERVVAHLGDAIERLITRLGVNQPVTVSGATVGRVYYYDTELANYNKMLIGIPISVVFVLIGSGVLLLIIALFIAYQLSKWLASPLMALLPSIESLGRGELGVQADYSVNDEYGRIANAFNRMSTNLEQSEKLRRNLTADIAHELRTPLTIIGGKLDHLQQQGQPVPPEALLPLQDELIRLNRLVEDLRTLSSAEAGQLTLSRADTDMLALAKNVVEAVEPLAEEKEISIRVEASTDRTIMWMDPNRMKQVLVNLLTNAIRYTPNHGLIQLHVRNDDEQSLALIVQDSGIGIAPEHLPYVFDRFYRADEARVRETGGTGLGLAIAKQFVLSHGGTIDVESELHKGTRFRIRIPYE